MPELTEEKKEEIVTPPADLPTAEETPNDDQKSRTQREFEKLKESNDQLKVERDGLKDVLSSIHPKAPTPSANYQQPMNQAPSANQFQNLNQADVNNVFASMVDADGYLDGNKLMSTLQQMNQQVINSNQRAARVEEHLKRREVAETEAQKTTLMRDVHSKYPELDPESESFDEEFYDLVRNDLIGQLMEGREDPMSAADKWAGKRNMTRAEKQIKETKEDQKSQINAVRPRSPMMKGYYEKEESQNLINQVRQGKKGALAEALRRQEQRASQ